MRDLETSPDIIKSAQQLLDGATPGPWVINGEFDPECPELQGAPQLENGLLKVPIISHDIYGDFFPEDGDLIAKSWTNARALAEETWEYSYQELRGDEWETAFNDVTHLEEWWPKKSDADWIVEEARKHGYVCRLVRRRVSPVEIVND